jgi:predicted esterase
MVKDFLMNRICLILPIVLASYNQTAGQVDTSYIYNQNMPYGTLDLRISKSDNNYYYLVENKTFSFRTDGGKRTDNFLHMTAWDTREYQQGQLREKFATTDRFTMNYRLLLPENYKSDVEYPIVLFLHGLQESGNCAVDRCFHADREYDPNENIPAASLDANNPLYNNDYNLLHGGRNYLNARNRAEGRQPDDPNMNPRGFPGFALFPQSNNEWSPYEIENALRILRLLIKRYNIDPNRVYINGLSKGGYGAFEAMKRAPWLFAAGAMFSPIHDGNIISLNLISKVQHIPLWIFQGGQDQAPLPRDTEERVRKFRTAGMSVKFTLYPNLGHATWNAALEEPDFFKWLLGQYNNHIHAFGGGDAICQSSSEGLNLTLPPGFPEYEWQLNGKTIKTGRDNFLLAKESGAYRARYKFKDTGEWNKWSKEIKMGSNSPEQAEFKQQGTLHLPDMNGTPNAVLESAREYNHYLWYRYEDLMEFPGDADDTMKIATIKPSAGSGYYSLRVADFDGCYSPPSEARKIFFGGKSPVNITAPEDLALESRSPSQVNVTWKDKSDNEANFEIWRRLTSGSSPGPWFMSMITNKDVQSFTDTGMQPSSKYEYKIRAVSNLGRSNYFPGSGAGIFVETPADETPPERPTNLNAELTDVNQIEVRWNASIDDSSIKEYELSINDEIIKTGNADTTYVLKNMPVNTSYTIKVSAVDVGGNTSEESDAVTVSTEMTGLFYKHTTGAWRELTSVDWSFCEYEGRVRDFSLSPKRQDDFFNFRFDGYLYIYTGGPYQFRITSNDGSRLRLNDTLVVENDGVHEMEFVESEARSLQEGPQLIRVDFFDYMDLDSLIVEYNGADTHNEWKVIGSHELKSSPEAGSSKIEFSVHPNPVMNGVANISLSGGNGDPITITISNTLGQKIREYVYNDVGQSSVTLTDLDFDSGVYIVTIYQSGNFTSQRLVNTR